jgi:hypothetical protein
MNRPVDQWVQADVDMAQSLTGRTIAKVESPTNGDGLRYLQLTLDDGRHIMFTAEGWEADNVGIYDDRGI